MQGGELKRAAEAQAQAQAWGAGALAGAGVAALAALSGWLNDGADGPKLAAAGVAAALPVILLMRKLAAARADAVRYCRLALTDTLTNLPNRAATMAAISRQIETCLAEDRAGALLYIDLDHFKAINDNFGHAGGDAALRHAAELMREVVDPDMIVGRLGGEEFVIFAPDASRAGSVAMAILIGLRATTARHGEHAITVTASIGMAMMGDSVTPEALLANADRALYLAKSAGRDRLVHHDELRALEWPLSRIANDPFGHAA
jgi:diguanylate cyclase (GGDEF)-like protein